VASVQLNRHSTADYSGLTRKSNRRPSSKIGKLFAAWPLKSAFFKIGVKLGKVNGPGCVVKNENEISSLAPLSSSSRFGSFVLSQIQYSYNIRQPS
jgi:hypothetical protein